MLKRFDGHLEDETLLRIDEAGFPRSDAEEFRVEAGNIAEECTPSGGLGQRLSGLRGAVVERLPPVLGDGGDRRSAFGEEVPQRIGAVDVTG